jgi:hypothetical protein
MTNEHRELDDLLDTYDDAVCRHYESSTLGSDEFDRARDPLRAYVARLTGRRPARVGVREITQEHFDSLLSRIEEGAGGGISIRQDGADGQTEIYEDGQLIARVARR